MIQEKQCHSVCIYKFQVRKMLPRSDSYISGSFQRMVPPMQVPINGIIVQLVISTYWPRFRHPLTHVGTAHINIHCAVDLPFTWSVFVGNDHIFFSNTELTDVSWSKLLADGGDDGFFSWNQMETCCSLKQVNGMLKMTYISVSKSFETI